MMERSRRPSARLWFKKKPKDKANERSMFDIEYAAERIRWCQDQKAQERRGEHWA